MLVPEPVKRAFAQVAESDMSADDKLVVAVYLAHGIGRLPEPSEDIKLQVTDTRISSEDAEWWAGAVARMTTEGQPSQVMNWINLGPGVKS